MQNVQKLLGNSRVLRLLGPVPYSTLYAVTSNLNCTNAVPTAQVQHLTRVQEKPLIVALLFCEKQNYIRNQKIVYSIMPRLGRVCLFSPSKSRLSWV